MTKPNDTERTERAVPSVAERFRNDIERLAQSIHVDGLAGMVEWRKDPDMEDIAAPFFDIWDTHKDAIAEIGRLEAGLDDWQNRLRQEAEHTSYLEAENTRLREALVRICVHTAHNPDAKKALLARLLRRILLIATEALAVTAPKAGNDG